MAARVSQFITEVAIPYPTYSPTTPTGAGASQLVLEAIVDGLPDVCVSQLIVELIIAGTSIPSDDQGGGGGSSGGGGQTSFGYAV
jgi:hypothetical protein